MEKTQDTNDGAAGRCSLSSESDSTLGLDVPLIQTIRSKRTTAANPRSCLYCLSLLANVALVSISIILYLSSRDSLRLARLVPQSIGDIDSISPAWEALTDPPPREYIPFVFQRLVDPPTEYQGFPSDELDARWEDLYAAPMNNAVEKEKAMKLANKTLHVPLPGLEDKYMMLLDVFHQLHCLDEFRKLLYPKHYNSSFVASDGVHLKYWDWYHMDHCVESLRQSIMCHSDVAVNTFVWKASKIMEPNLGTLHVCRNFTKIREWAMERAVEITRADKQKRVEHGRIVDYGLTYANAEDLAEADDLWGAPEDWLQYTIDDL
ncbi:hypothetical protein KVR01_013656 [Diaporthe batatas]|uniref:uncharacterized protein n=1 Tax=Diaporthe batatas TaxID=748121 RepID=UPI001D040479|nr:uncharacterized protein KVR01_013656 [Diaporthe batatas]KAG8156552.1 hypothetical protein KVR01_013656 [Diaporthe batatas]